MFNLHWWENLVMSQARVMREDVVAQNREIMDGAAVGKQEKELGELKLVLGEHENGFSFGAFLQGFARLSFPSSLHAFLALLKANYCPHFPFFA